MYSPIDIPASAILLIDDHALVVEGFRELLKKLLPEGCAIDAFTSITQARSSLQSHKYHFVVTDLMMPGQNVPDFMTCLHKDHPDLIIIGLSSMIDINRIKEYFAIGMNGYLSKGAGPEEIKYAFENTFRGQRFISNDLRGKLFNNFLSVENTILTKKELEVLRLIAGGAKNQVIAEKLHVSPVTIATHKRSLMHKLDLHSTAQLVKYAYENHLV